MPKMPKLLSSFLNVFLQKPSPPQEGERGHCEPVSDPPSIADLRVMIREVFPKDEAGLRYYLCLLKQLDEAKYAERVSRHESWSSSPRAVRNSRVRLPKKY